MTARRVAVVTGVSRPWASRAGIARRLAADGWRLVLHAWAALDAEQPWGADARGPAIIVDELRAADADVVAVSADFAEAAGTARVMSAAVEVHGHVDALVASHARSSDQALEELTADELQRTFAVNATATLLLTQAFAAQHDGRDGGRVVWVHAWSHGS